MLWSRRQTVLSLAAAAALSTCGFEPVYGPGGNASRLQGKILVAEPSDRDTFLLVQELERRFGRSSEPEYDLSIALLTVLEGQAVTVTGDITRFSLVAVVDFQLVDRSSGAIVAEGSVRNFTGYSATGSTVETLAARRDSQNRLMIILADQIVAQVYATAEFEQ